MGPFNLIHEPAIEKAVCLLFTPTVLWTLWMWGLGSVESSLGDSLMCLPGKQILLGRGARTPLWLFFYYHSLAFILSFSIGCVVEWLWP